MQLFNENDLIKITEAARKQHLSENIIMHKYNVKKSQSETFYTTPWCSQVSHDYCPFVISLMSFVCLISLMLIIFICVRGSIECAPFRKCILSFRRTFFKRQPNENSRLSYDRSILPPTAMDLSSPINRSFFDRVNNFTHSSPERSGQVWFTDISKTRPPPTYEESQTYTVRNLIKPVPINPIITRTYPQNKTATNITLENEFSNEQTAPLFPSYRCLTLTSSPSVRSNLNRLGDLSRQLLEENVFSFSRMGSLNINNDEVPPAYDSIIGCIVSQNGEVVGTFEGNQQYISNERLV